MWKPTEKQKEELRVLYKTCPLTVDRLPYSPEFEILYKEFDSEGVSKNELFLALANMRKRKELPRKAR